MYRIGIFATGRGQGSRSLLQAIHDSLNTGHLPASVAFVFSNRDPGEFEATDGFFDQVRGYGYPLVTCSFRKFREAHGRTKDWRTLYERQAASMIEPFKPDLTVMAGFLLIVPELSKRYSMINLHPAAPGGPTGMWQEVIWQLIDRQAATSGNTIAYVTEDLDCGPTVAYSTFPIRGGAFDPLWSAVKGRPLAEVRAKDGEELPLFQLIRQHGMARERPLVVETLKAFAEGHLRLAERIVIDGGGKPVAGLDLTARIEAIVQHSI